MTRAQATHRPADHASRAQIALQIAASYTQRSAVHMRARELARISASHEGLAGDLQHQCGRARVVEMLRPR